MPDPGKRTKVLIIDDEADFGKSVQANLEQMGYEVLVAVNARKGMEMARWDLPDVILLDITMPGVDGIETLKQLKSNQKTAGIPVLMLTARTDMEAKMETRANYDDAYIEKPVQMEDLKARIEKVLNRFKR